MTKQNNEGKNTQKDELKVIQAVSQGTIPPSQEVLRETIPPTKEGDLRLQDLKKGIVKDGSLQIYVINTARPSFWTNMKALFGNKKAKQYKENFNNIVKEGVKKSNVDTDEQETFATWLCTKKRSKQAIKAKINTLCADRTNDPLLDNYNFMGFKVPQRYNVNSQVNNQVNEVYTTKPLFDTLLSHEINKELTKAWYQECDTGSLLGLDNQSKRNSESQESLLNQGNFVNSQVNNQVNKIKWSPWRKRHEKVMKSNNLLKQDKGQGGPGGLGG